MVAFDEPIAASAPPSLHRIRRKATTQELEAPLPASAPSSPGSAGSSGPRPQAVFPTQLLEILCDPSSAGVIEWLAHGHAFAIKHLETFIRDIMPKFTRGKLTSFQRQLNLYGFRKVTKGADVKAGALVYFHPAFKRGRPEMMAGIKRIACKGELTLNRLRNDDVPYDPKVPSEYTERPELDVNSLGEKPSNKRSREWRSERAAYEKRVAYEDTYVPARRSSPAARPALGGARLDDGAATHCEAMTLAAVAPRAEGVRGENLHCLSSYTDDADLLAAFQPDMLLRGLSGMSDIEVPPAPTPGKWRPGLASLSVPDSSAHADLSYPGSVSRAMDAGAATPAAQVGVSAFTTPHGPPHLNEMCAEVLAHRRRQSGHEASIQSWKEPTCDPIVPWGKGCLEGMEPPELPRSSTLESLSGPAAAAVDGPGRGAMPGLMGNAVRARGDFHGFRPNFGCDLSMPDTKLMRSVSEVSGVSIASDFWLMEDVNNGAFDLPGLFD